MGTQPKREITPHKGGRSIRVNARITPATKMAIDLLGISIGDLIEWAAQHYKEEERQK